LYSSPAPPRIDYNDTQDNGEDIRFIDGTTGAELSYEIEEWNELGDSLVWVNVPQIDGSSTTDYIWLHHNNPTATDAQDPAGVWNTNYAGVWHLKETDIDGGSGDIKDSTTNLNNGTTSGMDASDQVAGKIDGSFDFDGSNDKVDVSDDSSLNIRNAITMETWVNASAYHATKWNDVLSKGPYDTYIDKNGKLCAYIDTNGGLYDACPGTINMVVGTWYHVAVTYNGGSIITYVNGAQDGTASRGTTIDDSTGLNFMYGTCEVGECYFWNGKLDEVRISDTVRSADWLAAQYLSMTDAFITYE